jgi:hypothetical protein
MPSVRSPIGHKSVLLLPALLLGLGGCAVTAVDGSRMGLKSDEFATYVEKVFRQQNEVASALALELESEDPGSERYAELDAAELALLDACVDINELAAAQRDDEPLRGFKALARARQTPECERATVAAMNLVSDT